MEVGQIVVLVLFVILLTWFFIWLFSKSKQLTNMMEGNLSQTILAKTLPVNNNTSNYTYSMWLYINDWNYRFGQDKVVLARLDADKNPGPSVSLGGMENNLTVKVSCYPISENATPIVHECGLSNIPLQKWVNVIISLYGRTLDVYLDGKLVRTCVLPGVAKVNADADIVVTPEGGFSGWTTNFQYWPAASNPQQAYDIYKNGLGGSILGNLLNKFRIRVSFVQDNKVKSSFEI
jgi:hypothetical protein